MTLRGGAQDAAAFLAREPACEADIVLAADVAPWVGALEPLLAGAAHALAPGGLLALSTEEERAGGAAVAAALPPRQTQLRMVGRPHHEGDAETPEGGRGGRVAGAAAVGVGAVRACPALCGGCGGRGRV